MLVKRKKSIFILILIFLFTSCSGPYLLYGHWKSEERDLVINQDRFELIFHKSNQISCFQGTIDIKPRFFVLKFEQYVGKDGSVNDLAGSELFGHIEEVGYRVNKRDLETFVRNTGKIYRYARMVD